jgi:hypothetical protein
MPTWQELTPIRANSMSVRFRYATVRSSSLARTSGRVLSCAGMSMLIHPRRPRANLPTWQNPESMKDSQLPYDRGMPPTGHQVSPKRLEEFRRIYKEAYGEEISTAEASAMTHRLLALYRLLSQPLPDEDEKPAPSPPPPAQSAPEAS